VRLAVAGDAELGMRSDRPVAFQFAGDDVAL
jgi:hypothetical protein